jgi:hypothetical protein
MPHMHDARDKVPGTVWTGFLTSGKARGEQSESARPAAARVGTLAARRPLRHHPVT